MESQKQIISTFEEMAPHYEEVVDSELNLFWGWSYQGFVNTLLKMTPINPEDQILDIATGIGVIPTKIASQHTDIQSLHGLDITYPMLTRAKDKFKTAESEIPFNLVCASGMELPYMEGSFDITLCGLATHHMDVQKLLSEMYRVIKPGGRIAVADVGGSPLWKNPIIRTLIRLGAFVYFLFRENIHRAWAEADAVYNVRTKEEWQQLLIEIGFDEITVLKLKSKYRWIPAPLVIHAKKQGEEK